MPQHPDGSHGLRKPKPVPKKIKKRPPISKSETLNELQRRLKKRREAASK